MNLYMIDNQQEENTRRIVWYKPIIINLC